MRKSHAILLAGLATATVSGAALAAIHNNNNHVMNVALPDGSVAHITYYGDVAPQVAIDPAGVFPSPAMAPIGPGWFGSIDRMIATMNRQAEAIARQVPSANGPGVPGVASVASYGALPAGSSSYTMVSTSNGRSTCTRTTQVIADGNGKPPRVVSNASGDCAASAAPPAHAAPPSARNLPPSSAPIDHT